tara:strand:- start:1436 stop:1693 length:258 start_codon:yes stop_codon:yes gene_type:complete
MAYKYIVEYGTIEELSRQKGINVDILDHENVRQLFTLFDTLQIEHIPFCGQPDRHSLAKFFHEYNIQMNIDYYMSGLENQHIYIE